MRNYYYVNIFKTKNLSIICTFTVLNKLKNEKNNSIVLGNGW